MHFPLKRVEGVSVWTLIPAKEFTTTARDGTRCKLPIGPCGGWGFWLYLVLQPVTDTDTCEFIGLAPCFECSLKQNQYSVKYCETVSRTHREDALLCEAYQNKITVYFGMNIYSLHLIYSPDEISPPAGGEKARQAGTWWMKTMKWFKFVCASLSLVSPLRPVLVFCDPTICPGFLLRYN